MALAFIVAVVVLAQQTTSESGSPGVTESKHRSYLPMPNTVRPMLITCDAKEPGHEICRHRTTAQLGGLVLLVRREVPSLAEGVEQGCGTLLEQVRSSSQESE